MAESGNYPQLPRNVWRGVWDILRKTPKRKLDEKALSAELAVQPTAAKAYSRELMKLGLLDEDSTPTELANRWRQDGQNTEILKEILEKAYPQDLRDLAPRDGADRDKIIRWFMNEGLGEGSAKNKAATYLMVASGVTDEASPVLGAKRAAAPAKTKSKARPNNEPKDVSDFEATKGNNDKGTGKRQSKPDLNVNVQIHISADASAEQIEAIFSSMKRYFDESD